MSANAVDGVREVSPEVADALSVRGRINDLTRDQVIVHVGKPVGSVSGWVGPLFWQVWVDRGDAPGSVHSRIGEGEAGLLTLDPALPVDRLLDRAKDIVIAQAQDERLRRLREAEAAQASLAT